MRNDAVTDERRDLTFAALADPVRREIVLRLATGPAAVNEITRPFSISRPAISRHLRVLREAGIVDADKQGRRQIYRLSPEALGGAEEFLAEVRSAWDTALSAFKDYVEHRS
jgi:DNA-binding transcriptional ArsR family regulator